ncbi:restriction endonuclease subunit S [Halodesulfurarchaeum sp. HSR-GB]|uniref:restriction endonuclease subunit S n=1 Tax=Halodesulfurarchaeum sp. HSR-GB TaxID=3074077 RepID=UPI0028649BA1|nr:restriction endonuclease subunit S [Halodesulfurarchaeum sp. HSR-GB]MDR5656505.1 restriction endonuclease subunit S [Halodesulfurarchaeum sp. HSR-GB]
MTQEEIEAFVEEAKTAEVSDEYGPGNERWEMRPLSELMEPVLGKTPKRSEDEYWGGDIRWASAKDISQSETRHVYDTAENMTEAGKEASNAKILPEGTVVVIARGATMGRVAQLGKPMAFNQTCYGLDTGEELLDDYLYYAWQYVFGQVQAVSYGTVFDTITMKSFEDIEIPVPPMPTQKKIAHALTAVDDKIESNIQISDKLDQVQETIFRKQFVEFSNHNDFKMTDIGEVPNEYEVKCLNEIADIELGNSPKSEYYNEEGDGLPFFQGSKNFGMHYPDVEKWCTSPNKTAEEGDILISIRAPVGDLNKAQFKCIIGRGITALSMKNHRNEFLYYLLKTNGHRWEQYASGTTFNSINKGNIESFKVVYPGSQEIDWFNKQVAALSEKIYSLHWENEYLEELRDELMLPLISGRVTLDT